MFFDQVLLDGDHARVLISVTYALVKVLDATIGLRVPAEEETIGLDQTEHAETACHLSDSSSFGGA